MMVLMYDETSVIFEEIARKFRASMEPFWDLKIGIYVEYRTYVSSEYITRDTREYRNFLAQRTSLRSAPAPRPHPMPTR